MAYKTLGLVNTDILQRLVDTGVDVVEVDEHGWNCLFQCVAFASFPQSARELRALRSLLAVLDDVHATDIWGNDIFSYANEEKQWYDYPHEEDCGSYRQDLWYCALKRTGLDARYNIAPRARIARYTTLYTPKHYRALCHLDFWDVDDFDSQVDDLLREYPMTEEETRLTKRPERTKRRCSV